MNKYIKIRNRFYNLEDKEIGFFYTEKPNEMYFSCEIQDSGFILGVADFTDQVSKDIIEGLSTNFQSFLDSKESVFDAVLNFEELVKEAKNKKVQ